MNIPAMRIPGSVILSLWNSIGQSAKTVTKNSDSSVKNRWIYV